ncbi:MAG: hypothetical protein JSW61_14405 [Candidatus Thorarchaeota archaeon]|nr:MAG: hypothetical protein JSW61_14405 [Candidatus Thorarchaeota archaeon]
MSLRRLFGRKKKDEDEKKESTEVKQAEVAPAEPEETVSEEPMEAPAGLVEEAPTEEITTPPGAAIPYHDSLKDRLMFFFSGESGAGVEAPDEFMIEFMAMGERFHIVKRPMGGVELGTGSISDEDAFVRVGQELIQDLLSAASFEQFSEIFIQYYRNPGPGKFIKIELRKAMFDLNRRGYARVPILKLLTGQAR